MSLVTRESLLAAELAAEEVIVALNPDHLRLSRRQRPDARRARGANPS